MRGSQRNGFRCREARTIRASLEGPPIMKKQPKQATAAIIERMRKSYADARKQMKKALLECKVGTAVYLQHVRALADLDAAERAEEIELGLSPQNLGAMV